jgi:hypothetical protein
VPLIEQPLVILVSDNDVIEFLVIAYFRRLPRFVAIFAVEPSGSQALSKSSQ